MSGIPFPQKTWTGAHEWTTSSSSVRADGTKSPGSQPVGVPTPPPPPLPVFRGSSKALLYPFCPASHFSCNKFIYTYVWPLPHLSTGFTTSHLISLLSHPCPVIPPVPLMTNTKAFLCLRISVTQTVLPTSALVAAVGCYVWSPSCLLPGDAKHLNGPLQWSGNPGLKSVIFLWGYESQPSFPQMTARNPKAGLLAPRRDPCAAQLELQSTTPAGLGCLRLCPQLIFSLSISESSPLNPMPKSLCVSSTSGDSKMPSPIKSRSSKTSL